MKNLFRKTKEEQRREKLSDESLGELISLSDLLIDDCISRDDFLLNVLISSGYTKNPEMEEIKTVWDKNKVNKHICRFRNDEGRSCMLKVYLATNCDDMEYLYRKMESVKIDSLPRVLGRGKYKDVYYVIEEYINGKALSKKITDTKDVLEILRLMKKVCNAVMPLHTEFKPAIVHCDVTPSNIILVEENGEEWVYLIDFDVAYEEGCGKRHEVGTKGFTAPEVTNEFPVTQSDIYSIGVILKKWFEASNCDQVDDSKLMLALNHVIDKSQAQLDIKGDGEGRYKSLEEFKQDLFNLEVLLILHRHMRFVRETKKNLHVYAYDSDVTDKLKEFRVSLGKEFDDKKEILYAVHDDKAGRSMVFTNYAMYSMINQNSKGTLLKPAVHWYRRTKVIRFDKIVGITELDTQENKIGTVTVQKDGDWLYDELKFPSFDTKLICEVINWMIQCREEKYNSIEFAQYYVDKCIEAETLLNKAEASSFSKWWRIIILMGTQADKINIEINRDDICKPLLLRTYRKMYNDAKNRLDGSGRNDRQKLRDIIAECTKKMAIYGDEDVKL